MDWILFPSFRLNKDIEEELCVIWYCLVSVIVAENSFIYLSNISLAKSVKASRAAQRNRPGQEQETEMLKKMIKNENTLVQRN